MRVFANSLPKSGSHLIFQLLKKLCYQDALFQISASLVRKSNKNPINNLKITNRLVRNDAKQNGVSVDIDNSSTKVKADWLSLRTSKLPDNSFCTGHAPYSSELSSILTNNEYKLIFIIRDPRDVALSYINHMLIDSRYPPHKYFSKMKTKAEQFNAVLNGFYISKYNFCAPLHERIDAVSGWLDENNTCCVRFEDIIGKRGGGTAKSQNLAVRKILNLLNIQLSESDFISVTDSLFTTKAETFFKGQIGQWNKVFDSEIKDQFKSKCGDDLIQLGYENTSDW